MASDCASFHERKAPGLVSYSAAKAPGLVSYSAAMEPAPTFGRTTHHLEICVRGRAGETLFETRLEWTLPDPGVEAGMQLHLRRRVELYWAELQRAPGGGRSWWLETDSEAEAEGQ
jgi:hypothetical protein